MGWREVSLQLGINASLLVVLFVLGVLFVFPDYQKSYFEMLPNVLTGDRKPGKAFPAVILWR